MIYVVLASLTLLLVGLFFGTFPSRKWEVTFILFDGEHGKTDPATRIVTSRTSLGAVLKTADWARGNDNLIIVKDVRAM